MARDEQTPSIRTRRPRARPVRISADGVGGHRVVHDAGGEDTGGGSVVGSTDADHERDEVFFSRVRGTGARCLMPVDQLLAALRGGLVEDVVEPVIEVLVRLAADGPEVVIAHPRADDEHVVVAEGLERLADVEVLLGVEAPP